MVILGLSQLLDSLHIGGQGAMYYVFPVQTVICAGVLAWFWRDYRLHEPRLAGLGIAVGLLVFALWVGPEALLAKTRFALVPRLQGFDPGIFASQPGIYWTELVLRFSRLVLVVPALEEVFWRGFLLRFLINEEFDAVPFGSYSRRANVIVAIGFMLEHTLADWPAALAAGVLYNWVAFRSRSLSNCILAHALTNALLGWYIMATHHWGFW